MELLLVRHALPVRRELDNGVADPELSEAGRAQARRLAGYLANERLHAIYASPLRRARETAEPVAVSQGLSVIIDEGLAEWDRSSSSYVPIEELKAANDPRWQALVRGEWMAEDESPEEFRQRVVTTIERLIKRHPSQKVAVICHGGVINGYLAHILGLSDPIGFFYPNYTSIHRVAAARSGERTVIALNETAHLRGTGLPIGLHQ